MSEWTVTIRAKATGIENIEGHEYTVITEDKKTELMEIIVERTRYHEGISWIMGEKGNTLFFGMYAKCEDILGENHIESGSYEDLQKSIPGIIKEIIDENGKFIGKNGYVVDRENFVLREGSKIKEIIAKKAREYEEIIEEEIKTGERIPKTQI